MLTSRQFMSMTRMSDSAIYAIGGENEEGMLKSIEKLSNSGWEKVFDLPVSVSHHCSVAFDDKTILIIGGREDNLPYSRKTFYFTPEAETLKLAPGSTLIQGRKFHSCVGTKSGDIIVAGGRDDRSELSTVEILHRRTFKWKQGAQLPLAISYGAMVADPEGGAILVGGQSGGRVLDTLYRLRNDLGKQSLSF